MHNYAGIAGLEGGGRGGESYSQIILKISVLKYYINCKICMSENSQMFTILRP